MVGAWQAISPSQCRGANDDVINQLEFEDSAGFDGSSGEVDIRLRGARVAARVIVHHHELD
jgi:hypothetical protein